MTTRHIPPVLLLAWRRPSLTQQVVAALRAVRPPDVFVSLDGPSGTFAGDRILIDRTREAIEDGIDWPCEVRWRFGPAGRSASSAVTDGIDWFFSQVDEGIVLEDDCVPHHDFFLYCAELLDRYRDVPEVMSISGDNAYAVPLTGSASYAFVRWPRPWGWASWRTAWQRYDYDLMEWQRRERSRRLAEVLPRRDERRLWRAILAGVLRRRPDSWDYRWTAAHLLHGGLTALPRTNLVRNIGFGMGARHTIDTADPRAGAATGPLLPLQHPATVSRDAAADRALLDASENSPEVRRHFLTSPLDRFRLRAADAPDAGAVPDP